VKKANRKTKQQRAVVYRGVDTRSEREVWYTDVWAVTVPLPYKGGKKAKLGRIREKHDSQDDANARKQEIDEFFFPTHEVGEITPVLPTRLGKERVTNCETVFLRKVRNETDWGDGPELVLEMHDFCKTNGFVPSSKINSPDWSAGWEYYLPACQNGEKDKKSVRPQTLRNIRTWRNLTAPSFGRLKMSQVRAPAIEAWLDSDQPILVRRESDGKYIPFTGQRPFSYHMHLSGAKVLSSFINRCAKKGWCNPVTIAVPVKPRELEERESLAISLEQQGTLMDWAMFYGCNDQGPAPTSSQYAAFYADGFYNGERVAEIKRGDGEGVHEEEGVSDVSAKNAKCNPRDSDTVPIFLVMAAHLKARGIYGAENLCPSDNTREVIQYLAGWEYTDPDVVSRAKSFLEFCRKAEIPTPPRGTCGPWPRNGLRALCLSMHYKLFRNEAMTVIWGGTSGGPTGMFRPHYKRMKDVHKHRFTNEDAKQYWTWLPKWIRETGVVVELPKNHKLDDPLGPTLRDTLKQTQQLASAEKEQAPAEIRRMQLKSMQADLDEAEKQLLAATTANPTKGFKFFEKFQNKIFYLRRKRSLLSNGNEPVPATEAGGSSPAALICEGEVLPDGQNGQSGEPTNQNSPSK
jgi:hypothetical protein